MLPENGIYVYTKNSRPDSREIGFIEELQKKGYKIYINKKTTKKENVAIWFKDFFSIPKNIAKSHFAYNFIYNEEYSPISWENIDDSFILLTPYIEIYEHYMRSNIKSATFYLGVNTKDFSYLAKDKIYPLTYYELRNKNTRLAEYLKQDNSIKFTGRFWNSNIKENATLKDIAQKENEILNNSFAVIVDNPYTSKLIPEELVRATMSGALVLCQKTPSVYNVYKESLIYYIV